MAKKKYLGSKGAATRLGIAERTVRDWSQKFEWFGGVLENGDLVFTEEDIARMERTPRPTLGRPPGRVRKPVIDVPPEMPAPHPEDGPGVVEPPAPPPMPTLPVLAG